MKKYAKCGKIFLKLYHRYVDILCDTRSITINFQGGMTMRRLFKESKKIATFALAAAMAVTAAFGVAKVAWAEGEAETPIVTNVSFDLADDSVKVVDKQGEAVASTYYFYTTDKVSSKKIPAANKWKRTDGGTVCTYNIASKKVLYFAKTTTPSYDEVVAVEIPAAPKVKSAKYNAPKNEWTINTNTNAADKFVRISTEMEDMSLENFKATDSESAPARERLVNSMYGQTVDVYIAPVGTDGDVLKSGGDTSNMVAKLEADTKGVYKFPEKAVRGSVYSTSKRVKVGNRAGGPAVTIDYANHCIKVSSATEVAEGVNIQEPSDFKNTIKSTDESVLTSGNTVYYFFNDADKVFDVRTKATDKKIASMDTPVAVPATKEFEANASIIGGFEKDAYLEIAPKVKGENSSSVSYQYVVLDKAKYEKVVKGGKFDYKTAMGEKLSWKTIKYTVDKNGNAKNATAKIVNSKTNKTDKTIKEGGVVLVREAGSANKPSSKVMIFTVPTKTNPYWTSQKIGAEGDATKEISVSPVTVEGTNLVFTVYNAKGKVTSDTVKDKITLNRTAATVTVADVADTNDVEVTISVPDTLKKDSVNLTVAAKAGFITNSTYTFSYKLTKADVKVPSIASATEGTWVVADDERSAKITLTVQLSENIAKNKGNAEKPEYVALDAGEIKEFFAIATENYTLNKATYTKATSKKKANIVFELTYDLTEAASAAGKITYADKVSLYDATGHELSLGDDGIAIKADSSAKKYTPPAAQESTT